MAEARFVLVSTDDANKTLIGGPFMVDPAAMPAAPAESRWITEAAARTGGYVEPSPPAEQVNAVALRDRATQALALNAQYLAIASPTNTQVATQVRRLTQECSAIIRLLVGALDSTDGT
jgi:hypothetical protein